MGFLSILPSIMSIINRIIPDRAQAEAAKLELMRIVEENRFKELEITLQDTDSARQMYRENKDRIVPFIAWTVIILYFTTLLAFPFMAKYITGDYSLVYTQLIGGLSAGFGMVLSFFFGSSGSSRTKDNALAESLTTISKQITKPGK